MKPFVTGHEDLIHDVKYDYYGKHIATASSDQHIKVFDLNSTNSTWVLNDLWKAHDSLVMRVSWADPIFSSSKILASCSFDRTVKIWQEQPEELHGSGRRWVRLATLAIESYGPIYDVVFAPAHLGLKLGCVGLDGIFRIYESLEPSDLSNWMLTTEIPLLNQQLPAKTLQSTFSIEWCPSRFTKTEKFIIVALDQGFVYGEVRERDLNFMGDPADHVLNDKETGTRKSNSNSKYSKLCSLPEHNGLIRSVSWAPSMGRDYHLIATACKDGYVRIFKAVESTDGEFKMELLAKLNDHKLEVWRVGWNLTGTILSSAGDDGYVRLWKCNYLKEWKCMSVINSSNRVANRMIQEEATKNQDSTNKKTT